MPRPSTEQYLGLFGNAQEKRRVGEASVWYLYSEAAATEIKQFCPEASIIIMLRNPADFLYSLHGQMLYTSKEDLVDFGEALNAEGDRKAGRQLPRLVTRRQVTNYDPKILYYREIATFSLQVERYLRVFGQDRVHVIVHEELKRDTASVYRRVLEFLGVDPDFRPEFPLVNVSKRVRNHPLQRVLQYPPKPFVSAARTILPRVKWRNAIKSCLYRLNSAPQQRPPLDPVLRSRLLHEFRPEVKRLSQVLGRDLTFWCAA
jgi:hypothetical protein